MNHDEVNKCSRYVLHGYELNFGLDRLISLHRGINAEDLSVVHSLFLSDTYVQKNTEHVEPRITKALFPVSPCKCVL